MNEKRFRNGRYAVRLLLAVCIALPAGACSGGTDNAGRSAVSQTVSAEESGPAAASVPVQYEQLQYRKYSETYGWKAAGSAAESGRDVPDRYELYRQAVPGGFLVSENEDDYYICVSVGKKPSANEGFRVEKVTVSGGGEGQTSPARPFLTISIRPTADDPVPEGMKGEAFVTSLLRIPKQQLPSGTVVRDILMIET
jgi:hypothetical protein